MSRVPSIGPPNPKIVFISESPTAEEEKLAIPFSGSSGKLLYSVLAAVGIDRHECYFTYVVPTRPGSNNFEIFYEDGPKRTTPSPLLRKSITHLCNELQRLRPNVIVPLGGEALRALTGKDSIDKWRGSILPSPSGKVLSTYSPARIMREYNKLPVFTRDLERVAAQSKFSDITKLGHVLEINPSYSRVIEYLNSLLQKPVPISFDIETTRNHVRCLGIADSKTHAICIPFISLGKSAPKDRKTIFIGTSNSPLPNSHWSEEEEYQILFLLDKIFRDPRIEKVAQNIPFDSQVLAKDFGLLITNLKLDTLVASHTLYAELPKDLDMLRSLYTDVPLYSEYDASVDEETWTYNCFDACVTYEVAEKMLVDLSKTIPNSHTPSFTSLTFQENHIQPAMQVMTVVSQRGVLIDTKVRDDLHSKYTAEMIPLLAEFQRLAGGPYNPSSPKQMQDLLYTKLRLPIQINHKTKKVTTDENAIEAIQKKHPEHKPMFDALLDWKERQKIKSTYLEIALTQDNRIKTGFNSVGTVNGRCNSSKNLWGEGSNLQNIPVKTELGKVLRKMFMADPGTTMIKTDLSQAQFRMAVWFGKVRRIIDRYTADPNFDVHTWVASLIYKKTEAEVIKAERNIAKNGVYGGNFGMMPTKAAQVYKLDLKTATFVLDAYRKAIPEIPLWWKMVQSTINSTRQLINPLGRIRVFMDRIDEALYRDAYAAICQMTEADLIHRAIILSELTLAPDAWPVLQVHDEIVLLCKTEKLFQTLPRIKQIMEYPLFIEGVPEPLIIPADVSYGPNWLEMTKWKP